MAGVRGSTVAAPVSPQALKSFAFETITVDRRGYARAKSRRSAYYFEEDLGDEALITLVVIPGGSFLMGASPARRAGLHKTQLSHQVSVPAFFMGQYPVTQTQWERVARLPKVERDLDPRVVGSEAGAPDHVPNVEDAAVVEHRQAVLHADGTRKDTLDSRAAQILLPVPEQRDG